jgi:hypothetical protein
MTGRSPANHEDPSWQIWHSRPRLRGVNLRGNLEFDQKHSWIPGQARNDDIVNLSLRHYTAV